jgi:DNA repair exonuclease SbcCD ATPase subunit
MHTAKTIKLTPGVVPEAMYNEALHQLDFLKEFIGSTTIEHIKHLEEEVKRIPVLEIQVQEKDRALEEVKRLADKRVQDIKAHMNEQAEKYKDEALQKQRYNINYTDINPLKKELESAKQELESTKQELGNVKAQYIESETLLRSRDEEIQRLDTLQQTMESMIIEFRENFNNIIRLLDSGASNEEVKNAVNKSMKAMSSEELDRECEQIFIYTHQGLTNKQIGEIMYPDVNRAPKRVSDRRDRAYYKKISDVKKDADGNIIGVILKEEDNNVE